MQVEPVKPEQIGAVLAERQKKMNASISTPRPFYDELVEILNFLRSGTSDFRRYLEQANISEQFKQGTHTYFISPKYIVIARFICVDKNQMQQHTPYLFVQLYNLLPVSMFE